MASLTLASTYKDLSRRKKILTVAATPSGNYVQGTPIVVDLTTITNPKMISNGKIAAQPDRGIVINSPNGYDGELIQGTTLKNWGLKIWVSGGGELATGAIPAALATDPFLLEFAGKLGAM